MLLDSICVVIEGVFKPSCLVVSHPTLKCWFCTATPLAERASVTTAVYYTVEFCEAVVLPVSRARVCRQEVYRENTQQCYYYY